MRKTILVSLLLISRSVMAGECEDNFSKSGGMFKGGNFNSSVTVPNLSVKDGMGQMRGIMIREKWMFSPKMLPPAPCWSSCAPPVRRGNSDDHFN